MPVADHVAYETATPGVMAPNFQNPEKDKAIAGGWRRESPPAAFPEYADPFMKPVFITLASIPYETR